MSTLIPPDELNKSKKKKEPESKKEKVVPFEESYPNFGQASTITYASEGRFSIPGVLHINDYTSDDVLDLSMVEHNELPKTLIHILDRLKVEKDSPSLRNLTPDELIETLISLKAQYDPEGAREHVHQWICDCQSHLPSEMQKINKTKMDLRGLNFQTASQADDIAKKNMKAIFEEMTEDQFKNYLNVKYENNSPIKTIEEEVARISIKDIISLVDNDTNIKYEFIFPRMGHLIDGYDIADEEMRWPIEKIKQKKVKTEEQQLKAHYELSLLEKEKAKKVLKYITALSLHSINGQVITDNKEKIRLQAEGKIPADIFNQVKQFHNAIEIGLCDEREFECPLCHEKSGRLLQHEGNLLLELLPISSSNDDTDTRKSPKNNNRIAVFFG